MGSLSQTRLSDFTFTFHFHFSLSFIGEGNGNPLQCSCLENPWDGGAWWAAIYGVAQSRTLLKRLSSSSSSSRILHLLTGYFHMEIHSRLVSCMPHHTPPPPHITYNSFWDTSTCELYTIHSSIWYPNPGVVFLCLLSYNPSNHLIVLILPPNYSFYFSTSLSQYANFNPI